MQLHHIGVACQDIGEGIERLSLIHDIVARTPVIRDPEQDADVVMLTLSDGTRIELVAGRAVEMLVKRNIGLYHLCFEVSDIDGEIGRLVAGGAKLIVPPKPAALFDGRPVAFLYAAYGMIELLSQKQR
ncbi:MAG TPA: VOC family protein [Puia sp.]|jgi:methylmalonyl-CoA/ethylmalonyl-CoA epimerase|nr:VOC family protein [Puia sp.]